MGVSGLIAELVLPGGIIVAALILLAWGLGLAPVSDLSTSDSAIVLALGLVAAYLVGLVSREAPVVSPTERHYRSHLQEYWPDQTRYVLDHLRFMELSLTREPLALDATQPLSLTDNWTHDFVGVLRDYLLATCEGAWSEYLMYQWNVARLARNSILPLWILAASLLAVGIRRLVEHSYLTGAKFAIACLGAIGLSCALRYVYRARLCWHVEILLRTACGLIAFDGLHSNRVTQLEPEP